MGDGLHVNESDGSVFNTDGAVPIDHNVRVREMKRAVLNRKKLLVREQPPGGRTAAILVSLTKRLRPGPTNKKARQLSCKPAGVNRRLFWRLGSMLTTSI